MKPKKFLVIINPIAGGNNKEELIDFITETFKKKKLTFEIYETSGKSDSKKIKQLLENFSPDVAVAVGGDGTCHMVAALLINTSVKLAIIPFGSANGLAKELGIPNNPFEATDILFSHKIKDIDAICINGKHFCLHLSDLGINAQLIEEFEKSEKRGMLNYFKFLLEELLNVEPKEFIIETDGTKKIITAAMVALANASRYGTGAVINPKGSLSDGKFEICIVKPYPALALVPITLAFFNGTIHESEYIDIFSCEKVVIKNKSKALLQVDGEIIGNPTDIQAEILPKAVKMLIPKTST